MFAYLEKSELSYIIYRPNFHNLQANRKKLKKQLIVETETEQCTDQTKKAKTITDSSEFKFHNLKY